MFKGYLGKYKGKNHFLNCEHLFQFSAIRQDWPEIGFVHFFFHLFHVFSVVACGCLLLQSIAPDCANSKKVGFKTKMKD